MDRVIYKKINTRRGVYFVPWRSEYLNDFIKIEGIQPDDYLPASSKERKKFIRELFLQACILSLNSSYSEKGKISQITEFVRNLSKIKDEY